jgi:hypothetical protein
MKIFVWQQVKNCTDNWHSEGGVVVVAENLARAKEIAAQKGCIIDDGEWPDMVSTLYDFEYEERIFIMPNAGCC